MGSEVAYEALPMTCWVTLGKLPNLSGLFNNNGDWPHKVVEETLINWLGNSQYRQLYKYLPIYNELTAYESQKICIITENPVWTPE